MDGSRLFSSLPLSPSLSLQPQHWVDLPEKIRHLVHSKCLKCPRAESDCSVQTPVFSAGPQPLEPLTAFFTCTSSQLSFSASQRTPPAQSVAASLTGRLFVTVPSGCMTILRDDLIGISSRELRVGPHRGNYGFLRTVLPQPWHSCL